MKYIANCDSFGVNNAYYKKGEEVEISAEEKAKVEPGYFNMLFTAIEAEEVVAEGPTKRTKK